MRELDFGNRYCIDTSALIDFSNQFKRTRYETLWQRIERMIQSKELISPLEVYKEIMQSEDKEAYLLQWSSKHKRNLFRQVDPEQAALMKRIVKQYPHLAPHEKVPPVFADPFLVALARIEGATVICNERFAKTGAPARVPDVCKSYDVKCVSLEVFMDEKKWKFVLAEE